MNQFFKVVNQLITKHEAAVLRQAASILTRSDKHDAFFFNACAEQANVDPAACSVTIGDNYCLVRIAEPAKRKCAVVNPVVEVQKYV